VSFGFNGSHRHGGAKKHGNTRYQPKRGSAGWDLHPMLLPEGSHDGNIPWKELATLKIYARAEK
jgi:hypothetical protein